VGERGEGGVAQSRPDLSFELGPRGRIRVQNSGQARGRNCFIFLASFFILFFLFTKKISVNLATN
jgi:hypothetical protein